MIKLSEMKSEQGLEVMAELSESFGVLLADDGFVQGLDETMQAFVEARKAGEDTAEERIEKGESKLLKLIKPILLKVLPKLAKEHREHLYKIVSVLSGTKIKELKEMNVFAFVSLFMQAINSDVLGFFTQSAVPEQGE